MHSHEKDKMILRDENIVKDLIGIKFSVSRQIR